MCIFLASGTSLLDSVLFVDRLRAVCRLDAECREDFLPHKLDNFGFDWMQLSGRFGKCIDGTRLCCDSCLSEVILLAAGQWGCISVYIQYKCVRLYSVYLSFYVSLFLKGIHMGDYTSVGY